MIDIHNHILPGLDDGPETVEESLEMAEALVRAGFTAVVATPHVLPGLYENTREAILDAVASLRRMLASEKIPLEVYPGSECRIALELPESLERGELVTLGDSGKYLLVEFPMHELPPYALDTLFRLQLGGVRPVIAHPERHSFFRESPRLLADIVERGALVQVTAGALTGLFGPAEQRAVCRWLREGLVHFVASDAHSNGKRLEAVRKAAELLGAGSGILLRDAPEAALQGCDKIPAAAPDISASCREARTGFLGRLFGKRR
ncbi:MAG: tyrosine-protein phosphatase [Thermacetogeniaceae bacterium]